MLLSMQTSALTAVTLLTDALSRARRLDDVYSAALDALQRSLVVDRAAVLLFDENAFMAFVASRGISEEYRRKVNGHTPWTPETSNPEPVLVSDVENDAGLATFIDTFRAEKIRALAFFPLNYRDAVIGKFMLYYAERHTFTTDEIELAKTIAGQIAFGVARVRAEEALAGERGRLVDMVSHVPGMVWETAGVPGNQPVTFVSEGIRDLIGYDPEDWLRNPRFWNELLVDYDATGFSADMRRAATDGSVQIHEFRIRRSDGRVIWVQARTTHRFVGDKIITRGVTVDITAEKQAAYRARFLHEASAALASSLDYETTLSRVAQLAVDNLADWCVIDVFNDQNEIERLAVVHRDEARREVAIRFRDEFPPSRNLLGFGREVVETGTAALLREMNPEVRQRLMQSPAWKTLEQLGIGSCIIAPLAAAGRTVGAITFVSASERRYDQNDLDTAVELARRAAYAIDNARLYRRAQETNRAKDEFLATLSHELRTPMTATLGWATMLRLGNVSPDNVDLAIDAIEQSTRAQAKLIDDILDVSRIVTGKLQLTIGPVHLPTVVQAAVDAIRPSIDAKGLKLDLHFDTINGIPTGDAGRLQQVIWNVLSNAVKFTPSGGSIVVSVGQRGADSVRILVRDSGCGIPKTFLPFLFERYRQADSSASRAHGGLGLGLAIVKSIVEAHGGSVTAWSEGEGKGATFTITLRMLPAATAVTPNVTADTPRSLSLSGVSVLVVEDDPATRGMLTAVLQNYGAEVNSAESAPAAVEALRRKRPSVILSDIAMPGEDGCAFLMRVRSGAVEMCNDIPAIALTAYAAPDERDRILRSGFRFHLAKPIDPITVVEMVRQAVQQ
jgi:PAS domain S-box-containing protein